MSYKPILIVAGEPYSIFSEIFFKTLKKYKSKKPIILIGSRKLLSKQMSKFGYNFKFNSIDKNFKNISLKKKNFINILDVNFNFKKTFDKISKSSNQYSSESFKSAIKILKQNKASGLINGPISKKTFLKNKYPGITEYLKDKNNSDEVVMLIYSKKFSVSPITTHLALNKVSKMINKSKIVNNVKLIRKFYKQYTNIDPKIAITGLNPHCESNFYKSEEENIIIPAIKFLKKKSKNIFGPFAADSLFMKNNIKNYDVVIGMYHDQVLTPAKAINDFQAINITLGLPFIRISPDHGTNNKMIGKNLSNPKSLIEAIKFIDNKCK